MNRPFNLLDESSPHLALRVNDLYAERGTDRLRVVAYVAVAIVALIVGMMLGQLGGEAPAGSRIAWPASAELGQDTQTAPRGRSWARIAAWPAPAEPSAQAPAPSSAP